MSRSLVERRRFDRLSFSIVAMFVVAGTSQAWLQVVKRQETLTMANKGNRFEVSRKEFARRGSIYSSDGKVLAQNADTFELSLTYKDCPKSESFFLALSEASSIPATELSEPAYQGSKSKTWQQPINTVRANSIQGIKTEWRADGVSLRRVPRREYPFGDATSGIIGLIEEGRNSTGLESSKDRLLSGIDGERKGMVDRRGAFLPMRMDPLDTRAVDGVDLTVTLNTALQSTAMAAVKSAVEVNRADQGVALVLEPSTGRVLAAASWVSGVPKQEENGFNPIVMGRFEPGSTFKILTACRALDEGALGPNEVTQCGGQLTIGRRTVHCAHGAHGSIAPREAISRSCNVSAATWALTIGRESMISFLNKAGLLKETQVGLPGEITGYYNPKDGSPKMQLANMGFGQALTVTPIALAGAFNAIANRGLMMRPSLIQRVGDRDSSLVEGTRLFSPLTAQTMLDYMVSTFDDESGTAHSLRIPGYRLAGKTGTAQKLNARTQKDKPEYVSNFMGFVPAENPVATIVVMIDNPKAGQYYGGSVAGPVFRELAQAVIKQYNLPKSR